MSVDPVAVLGAILRFLRTCTALDRVPVDDLWLPLELTDRLLRHLGVESEPDVTSGLLLDCIAAGTNARTGYWMCQHGTGPGPCEVCPAGDQDEVTPPSWARRSRARSARRRPISGCQAHRYGPVRSDSRRPAGRSR